MKSKTETAGQNCPARFEEGRHTMKRKGKTAGKTVLGILLAPAAAFAASAAVNTCIRIKNRSLLQKPIGQFVRLDGHEMNVLVKGRGKHTLVFLSGWGTTSPVLDFKALYALLENEFRIAVPEKFGYGFSDIVRKKRSFAANVELYRQALAALGIEGPYILCPHSLSGLEAMLWAQKYPHEVEAIVGLDTTPAEFADELRSEELNLRRIICGKLLNLTGLSRLGKPACLPQLTVQEKRVIRELCVRNTCNYDVVSECRDIPKACEAISRAPLPEQPCVHFISKRDPGLPWAEKWRKAHQDYADASADGRLVQLDCGHYVHDFEFEKIAGEIRELAKRLRGKEHLKPRKEEYHVRRI